MKNLLFSMIVLSVFSTSYAQDWSGWSQWKQSDCYEGIFMRHRSRSSSIKDKEYVQVEVKNTYRFQISVKTRLTNDNTEGTLYRLEIPAGGSIKNGSTEAFLWIDKKFYFLHDKVRFEGDKYGSAYRSCDKT